MTYENDPNRRARRPDETSYTGWIIGGVIVLAVIIGLFAMFGSNHSNTASNDANRPVATAPATSTAPATTGSETASTPANVPTPPAQPATPANR